MRRMVCAVRTSWCVFQRYRIWLAMVDGDARLHAVVFIEWKTSLESFFLFFLSSWNITNIVGSPF